jgi:signal transduction histidine kinase
MASTVSRWWARTDPVVRDWWPVAVVAALQQVGSVTGETAGVPLVMALLGLGVAVPLRWRSERPVITAVAVAVAVSVQILLTGADPAFGSFVALMIVSFATAASRPLPTALVGPALAIVPVAILGAVTAPLPIADLIFPLVYFGGSWGAGRIVRARQETAQRLAGLVGALEHEREENARLAAEAERHRIAREVHDVVAHSLGVVLIQSEAADALLDRDPAAARRSLTIICETARGSLEELRGVLGAMRADRPTPTPTVAALPDLIERFRAAGVPAHLELEGLDAGAALPTGVEATVYRLVQEALTNVLRHAGGAKVVVRVRRGPGELSIRVHDDGGERVGTAVGASAGFGLVGMRERVARHGGSLVVGTAEAGGFEVHATLPTRATAP